LFPRHDEKHPLILEAVKPLGTLNNPINSSRIKPIHPERLNKLYPEILRHSVKHQNNTRDSFVTAESFPTIPVCTKNGINLD